MKTKRLLIVLLVLATLLASAAGASARSANAPLGTAFTYQGRLSDDAGTPLEASCDFRFTLWDAESLGTQLGSESLAAEVTVSDGNFTAPVNAAAEFGDSAFSGEARWLEVSVRCPAGSGDYTPLEPRQALTAVPYASQAATAPWSGLSGVPAGFADGIDNNTTYTAGTGLRLAVGEFDLLSSYQLPQTCSGGQYPSWNTLSSRWGCATDSNTTYTAGSGLALDGTQFSVTGAPWNGLSGVPAGFADGTDDTGADWQLTGNSGTTPATNFIGTIDNQALVFKVHNLQILRLEPQSTSPNVIAGKDNNTVTTGVYGATISGGGGISAPNQVGDDYGTVSGGNGNDAAGPSSTVGGGQDNTASGYGATANGGCGNTATAAGATVGGGGCFDGGYSGNEATGTGSTVSGGISNSATGYAATVGGGRSNDADGDYSFVAGYQARNDSSSEDGVFLFADSNAFAFSSTAANQFRVRSTGGVQFVTAIDGSGNATAGVQVAAGGGSWSSISDRNLKANFAVVNSRAVLEAVAAMPISTWNYIAQDTSIRHIGPMAQDFYAAFGVGEDNTHIATIDADGVALAAIQGLNEIVQEKDAHISALETRLAALERQSGMVSPLTTPWPWLAASLTILGLAAILRRRGQ